MESIDQQTRHKVSSGFPVCLATFAVVCLANLLSFFVLSSGHGVIRVDDGVVAVGFPLVFFEKGGFDGRREFYSLAAAADLLFAFVAAGLVSLAWVIIARRRGAHCKGRADG